MLYTKTQQGVVHTAPCLPLLLSQLETKPSFNLDYIQEYLLYGLQFFHQKKRETIYQNIYQLPFGHQLGDDDLDQPNIVLLDNPDAIYPSKKEAALELKKLLKNSIANSLKNSTNVAIELSGGLDSSTVAAWVREALPNKQLQAYTNGVSKLNRADYDELKYSRLVSQSLHLQQTVIDDGFQFRQVIENHAKILGSFSEVLFPLLNYRCYEIARENNIDTLFSGFGGDEMISQYATQFIRELKYAGKFWRYYYEAMRSGHVKKRLTQFFSFDHHRQKKDDPLIHLRFLKNLPDWVNRKKAYDTAQRFSKALVIGELSTHLSRRVTTSKIIAQAYGIDYQFPLLDKKLIEYYYQLPYSLKCRHGMGRYLIRHVMKDYLPRRIVKRDNKFGATAPAAEYALRQQLPKLFFERISASYQGLLADYIDIPKLISYVEKTDYLDGAIVRLLVAILMFDVVSRH